MWERETLNLLAGDTHPANTSVWRLSNYLNAQFKRRIELSLTAYYQFALDDVQDARLLGTGELTTPLVGPLSQTTAIDFRSDSDPPQGVKKTDIKLSTSFGVKF